MNGIEPIPEYSASPFGGAPAGLLDYPHPIEQKPRRRFAPFAAALRDSVRRGARVRPRQWALHDFLMAVCAVAISYHFNPKYAVQYSAVELFGAVVFGVGAVVGGNVLALYERQTLLRLPLILARLGLAAAIGSLMLLIAFNLLIYTQIGRWILLLSGVSFFSLALFARALVHMAGRYHKLRVLFIGDESSGVYQRLREEPTHHLLIGFINETGEAGSLGRIEDIPRLARLHEIDDIVVGAGYMHKRNVLDRCFEAVRHGGCQVMDECSFHELLFEEVAVDQINEAWFHSSGVCLSHLSIASAKRMSDIALASAGLILGSPIMLAVYILIRITSPGPAIFRQVRCGQFGKPFMMYKFRTMRLDAEAPGQAVWAAEADPRVTRLGRFLRRSRLDELPQFWNILKGDMAFTGPRPERPELVKEIEREVPFFAFRHWVRPGLTGLAQIRFRYAASPADARVKLQYDLYYIKNLSIMLDLQILLRTITAVMRGSR